MDKMIRNKIIVTHISIFLFFIFAGLSAPAQDRGAGVKTVEKRIALVIGNGGYEKVASLKNPVNDARDVSAALRDLGFEVISGTDQTLPQMRKLLREFGTKLKQEGGVGLFYYAGHGVQVKGRNFLIPVDADIEFEVETEDYALDINSVLRFMSEAGNGFNIVILDACRNNPFARSWNRDLGTGGLAQISAPNGTFIAYATAPDMTASDGTDKNGLYTEELLKYIKQTGLKIEEVFKEVTKSVDRKSSGRQTPWVSSSLRGDFYFTSSGKTAVTTPTPTPVSATNNNIPVDLDAAQHFEIARAYSGKGDFDRALTEINKALKLAPNYANAYVMRGGIYHFKKMFEESIADCNKALELDKNSEFAYAFRGYSYNMTGKYDAAIADFNKAMQINPASGMAYAGRGISYSNLKEFPKALADLNQGIKLSAPDAQNFYNRGLVYANLQDNDRALEDFNKAIEINPNLAIAYFNRSVIYERKGDKTRSAADKKKYLQLMGIE